MGVKKLAGYGLSLVVALLLAEGAVRLAGPKLSSSFYKMDPDLGWVLRPNAVGMQTDENPVEVRINSVGMRSGREFAVAKPADTFRVAILGDSFAEAMQVEEGEAFPALLERQLEKQFGACVRGKKVEVLNFGVQGYGTAQELLVWRNKAKAFQPDAVVLLFYTGNDLYNNQRELNPTNADAAPYFRAGAAGVTLVPAEVGDGAWKERWVAVTRVSQLAQLVNEVYYKWRRGATSEDAERIRQQFGEGYMDRLIYAPPRHKAMEEAWQVTEAALPLFAREVEASGAKFYLALASSGIQVHPKVETRAAFLASVQGTDILYAERRLAGAAHLAKVPVVILAEAMQAEAEASKRFFHGFAGNLDQGGLGAGHWNQEGHKLVSGELAKLLCGGGGL